MRNHQVTSAPSSDVKINPASRKFVPAASSTREHERREHGADLGEGRGEARTLAADVGGEDLAGQQVGLGVGAEVGHEVEDHEAAEQQQHPQRFVGMGL